MAARRGGCPTTTLKLTWPSLRSGPCSLTRVVSLALASGALTPTMPDAHLGRFLAWTSHSNSRSDAVITSRGRIRPRSYFCSPQLARRQRSCILSGAAPLGSLEMVLLDRPDLLVPT